MKKINLYIESKCINENVKSYHPLYLYVTNVVQNTNTLLISNRDIKKIIDKIISCSENPKKSWINESNIIEFIITEDQHVSWQLSMNINYDINNKKFLCDGYDDKSQKNNKINKELIDWDKKTIHIYKGNTYTL